MRKPACWPRWGDEREMTAATHRAGEMIPPLPRSSSFAHPTWRRLSRQPIVWEDATAGKRTAPRRILCRDRKEANRYFNVVFSGSCESAAQNSSLPQTQRLSQEMMSFTHGAPTFYHLDIIEDRSQPAGA